MSLKATSHGDLETVVMLGKTPTLDGGLYKPVSFSSTNVGCRLSRGRDGKDEGQDTPLLPRPCRKPIRVVRPVSAFNPGASFIQINRLQGELVRKRKECEDLKQENKYLSNEIHMERIMMRTESELTMRNLRNVNQELQAQVKELKQRLHVTQQRATLCSRAAEEAEVSRDEAEKGRVMAEARALDDRRERDLALADKARLAEDLQQLKNRLTNVQLLLAQTEKNYFETKLKLDRLSTERQVLLEENHGLENERDELRKKHKQVTEENAKLKDKEASSRRRAQDAEDQCERATRALREAEREQRLAEQDGREKAAECLGLREKHQALAKVFRDQEDLKSQRQNKACQANIKSYFLCMTESDQRVKILRNPDGAPKNFSEGDPVYISTTDIGSGETGKNTERVIHRLTTPTSGRSLGPAQFSELSPTSFEQSDTPSRRSRTVVEYFWLPTDD